MPETTKTARPESRAAKQLREIFQSGRPVTYIKSAEEQRVQRVLAEIGRSGALPIFTWSLTEGLSAHGQAPIQNSDDARAALDFIANHPKPAIFHLKDFHEPLRDSPEVRRRLRDIAESAFGQQKFLVISSPVRAIPPELERGLIYIELRPPDLVELTQFLEDERLHASAETLQQIARALQGLSLEEARYALRRAQIADPDLGPTAIPALLEEKRLLVNRSGVIEFIPSTTNMADIGGLEGLKKWLLERRELFHLRETLSAEIVPKGLLFMGIPGCGKSLSVKAIATYFDLPLYRLDMIEIFSGRRGKPEAVFVEACRLLEDMAPAVLWFDEIEMGINSTSTGGEQGRIFAFFLTWMQEKPRGLFVAATANRIDLLPAEMLRKGRFDEVFFVDLPLDDERVDIFRIHLNRRGIDTSSMNLQHLVQFTQGWAGAEIEQCVVSALTKALLAGRPLVAQDVITAAVNIVPLSRTMKEQINHIRSWAFERAVRASPKGPGAGR